MDLTYLPVHLCSNTKIKYLLNLIDHFSKFIISQPVGGGSGKTVEKKLEMCFKEYGVPEQLGSDNGSEFTNKDVTKLLKKHNIRHVYGKPYCPHSQRIMERAHRTIKTAILAKYLENKKNFNLINSLKDVVLTLNNTIHVTTKETL